MTLPDDDNLFATARQSYLEESFPGDLGDFANKHQPEMAAPEIYAPGWLSVVLAASLLLVAFFAAVNWTGNSNSDVTELGKAAVKTADPLRSQPKLTRSIETGTPAFASPFRKRRVRADSTSMAIFGPSRDAARSKVLDSKQKVAARSNVIRDESAVRIASVLKSKKRTSLAQAKQLSESWRRWQKLKSRTRPNQKVIHKFKWRS